MSRGNLIQGQASGKLGSTVLMVRNGQQLARVYTTAGARSGDQASESARIQRVKFGSASNQWGLYRYVCTRMFRKGKKNTQSDYNYWVKRNSTLLPYFTRPENASGVHVVMPGVFSEGNLGRIELVYNFRVTPSSEQATLVYHDSQVRGLRAVTWASNVDALKATLAQAYPFARKVTFLISLSTDITLVEQGESFISQIISHYPVIIDLYSEVTQGENSMTVSAYFASFVSDAALRPIIAAQTASMMGGDLIFSLWQSAESENAILSRVSLLLFAADDNVSDCYTTSIPETAVSPTSGAYAVWAGYRTTESLRIAADSYGYQAGVMRDEMASYGNDLSSAVQAYTARLAKVDAAAAADYIKELEAAGGAKARTVRQAVVEEEE